MFYVVIYKKYVFGHPDDQNIFLIQIYVVFVQFLAHGFQTLGIS